MGFPGCFNCNNIRADSHAGNGYLLSFIETGMID